MSPGYHREELFIGKLTCKMDIPSASAIICEKGLCQFSVATRPSWANPVKRIVHIEEWPELRSSSGQDTKYYSSMWGRLCGTFREKDAKTPLKSYNIDF